MASGALLHSLSGLTFIHHHRCDFQEFSEYNTSLHDAQKWLLQISYQLMGQNAQYISSREQTLAQIDRHKVIVRSGRDARISNMTSLHIQ